MDSSTVRIVHMSDAHIAVNGKPYLPGIDLSARCRRAIAMVRALDPAPKLIVLGGDMLDEGPSPDYARMTELFAGIRAPVHLCLGNHDSLEAFRLSPLPTFPAGCPGYYAFDAGLFRVIILFTAAARRGKGRIDATQLAWLNAELAALQRRSALIFMHHPPVDIGIPWLDAIRVENAGEFWEAVVPYAGRMAGIFFAHLHIQLSMARQGILLASPPSIGWQFRADPAAGRAETSEEMPGFNIIDIWDALPQTEEPPMPARTAGLSVRTVRFAP